MSRPFSGVLTLTSAGTVYNLGTLIAAVDGGASLRYAEITLEAPANADTIKGGYRSSISDTDYGFSLAPSTKSPFGTGASLNDISARGIWLRAPTTASQKIHFSGRVY